MLRSVFQSVNSIRCRASTAGGLRGSLASVSIGVRFFATKRYTPDHEWISYDSKTGVGTMGISDYAQSALGDVVYVELPAPGTQVQKKDPIGAVESVKAASDVYAPVSGKIVQVNDALSAQPTLLNSSPEEEGWICKFQVQSADEWNQLLDASAYKKHCESK